MTYSTSSLAAIRAALGAITIASTDEEIDAACAAAAGVLRDVTFGIAGFANELEVGTEFFNSSMEFGRQLADQLEQARRVSTVLGLIQGLTVREVLTAVELALVQTQARTGPHALRREPLSDLDRGSLRRIGGIADETLVDAAMPKDPENEDD